MDPAGTQKVEGDPFLIYISAWQSEAGYSGAENSNFDFGRNRFKVQQCNGTPDVLHFRRVKRL
jgi:hypothetical protein